MATEAIEVKEQLVKRVVSSGNGGAVWVPRSWLGEEVVVIRPEKPELNIKEKNELITICDRFAPLKHSSQLVSSRVCAFIASLTISSSLPRPIPVPAQ